MMVILLIRKIKGLAAAAADGAKDGTEAKTDAFEWIYHILLVRIKLTGIIKVYKR